MTHQDLRTTVLVSFLVNLFLGFVMLPIWWFMVYAFADEVTATMHLVFLAGTGALGLIALGVSLLVAHRTVARERRTAAIAVTCATTAVMVLGTLAVGTVVSLLNEDQGSITADQPDAPFVALIAVCLLAVVGSVARALWAVRNI